VNPFLLIPYLLLQADHEKVEYRIVQFLLGVQDAVFLHALVDDAAIIMLVPTDIFHAMLVVAIAERCDQGFWQGHGINKLNQGWVHFYSGLAHLRPPLSTN